MVSNFKIQFISDIEERIKYNEVERWSEGHKCLIIRGKSGIKQKYEWIWKVINTIDEYYDDTTVSERDDEIIIDFYNFSGYYLEMTKEECYKSALQQAEKHKMILSKLSISNYVFIYEYEPTIEREFNFIKG